MGDGLAGHESVQSALPQQSKCAIEWPAGSSLRDLPSVMISESHGYGLDDSCSHAYRSRKSGFTQSRHC